MRTRRGRLQDVSLRIATERPTAGSEPEAAAQTEPDDFRIAYALTSAADRLMSARSPHEAMDVMVITAVDSITGVDQASVCQITPDGCGETIAASGDAARLADAARYGRSRRPWSDETDAVGAWMAMPLCHNRRVSTVLNLYSSSTGTFDPRTRHVAQLFASYARMGLVKAKSQTDLNQALVSRKDIGMAIGIVMERYGLSEDRAFRYLVRLSRSHNIKLRTVARQLVDDAQAAIDGCPAEADVIAGRHRPADRPPVGY
jgi:hypothetical protein